jgi:hypothetical protein
MLKILLTILCVYFLFKIVTRSFYAKVQSSQFNRPHNNGNENREPVSSKDGDVTIEKVKKSDPGTEYTDFEELK